MEVKSQWQLLFSSCLLINVVQQPWIFSPLSRLKHLHICGCHLCVQGLLSAVVPLVLWLYPALMSNRVVVLPHMLCHSWRLHHPSLTGISVFPQSGLTEWRNTIQPGMSPCGFKRPLPSWRATDALRAALSDRRTPNSKIARPSAEICS